MRHFCDGPMEVWWLSGMILARDIEPSACSNAPVGIDFDLFGVVWQRCCSSGL